MKSPSRYWREAATLILVGRAKEATATIKVSAGQTPETKRTIPNYFDYRALMLQRSSTSSFFAGMYVFPGGTVDEADFSHEWDSVFTKIASRTVSDISRDLNVHGPRPPMISANRGSTTISADIGFRICAIRETFEESGVLLATKKEDINKIHFSKTFKINGELESWRSKVHNDANQFIELCNTFDVVPNLWALKEWSNWLTPVMKPVKEPPVRPRRFDTLFYICSLEYIPEAAHDNQETTHSRVCWSIIILFGNFGYGMLY